MSDPNRSRAIPLIEAAWDAMPELRRSLTDREAVAVGRAIAALADAGMLHGGWRPMPDAKKDGTPVLAHPLSSAAEWLVDWMEANSFRLRHVQGFSYGADGLRKTIRDCWLERRGEPNVVIWEKQATPETEGEDHAEMMRQIEIYRVRLALATLSTGPSKTA